MKRLRCRVRSDDCGHERDAYHLLMMETCACEVRDDMGDLKVEGENVDLCSLMSIESGGTAHRPLDCPRGRVLDVSPRCGVSWPCGEMIKVPTEVALETARRTAVPCCPRHEMSGR